MRSLATFLTWAGLATSAPAAAAVTVIGGSDARVCYEAADSPLVASFDILAACDRALAGEPLAERDIVATHVNRGILRVRGGRYEAGIADFDAAIARDAALGEAWFNRGVAHLRRNAPAEALPSFDGAVARTATLRPALAYFGRAVAHEALGNVRAAYLDYRRASELEPGWDRPRAELARFAVRSD
ncbi:MAG TPA: tetratricopeptide repeat protein [Allosphingosinicella sp.]|jgi:tetratricopeptide (TPR) repeat protein